jgi:hypothetical protein
MCLLQKVQLVAAADLQVCFHFVSLLLVTFVIHLHMKVFLVCTRDVGLVCSGLCTTQ